MLAGVGWDRRVSAVPRLGICDTSIETPLAETLLNRLGGTLFFFMTEDLDNAPKVG